MQFKLQHANSQADDPHDVIAAQLRDLAPQLAHDQPEFNDMPVALPESASEPVPPATPLNDNTDDFHNPISRARSGRGVVLLIVCAGIAATAAWHFYGEEAKQRLSHFVPPLLVGAPAPTQNTSTAAPQDAASQNAAPQPAADPDPAPAQEAVATPTEPAAAPSTPAVETPPAPAVIPPELVQSTETMAREIAALKQTVEQLQASQQQLSRDLAKVTEREARRKPPVQASKPAPLPRPQHTSTSAAAPRPLAPYSPPQAYPQGQTYPQGTTQREAYVPPPVPTQLPPQPGDSSVPRPPMPLR